MPTSFQTTVPLFLLIVFGYIALVLFLGGKKAYFDPWQSPPDDPEKTDPSEAAKDATLKPGASPWKVGEAPSSSTEKTQEHNS